MSERRRWRVALVAVSLAAMAGAPACRGCKAARSTQQSAEPAPATSNLLLITIDTLRADAVGAYGAAAAGRTPALDALAGAGIRFERAFAPAPITLPSHASLLTGLYPPGHGARHNGMAMRDDRPTLATVCQQAGFATAAFISAFPLDRRFGLARGFDDYSDRFPRGPDMRPLNERLGSATVDAAIAWLVVRGFSRVPEQTSPKAPATTETSLKARATRFFLWVHLFEPHAPYGNPRDGRPAVDRYADEVAEADRQIGRLLGALGPARSTTLVIATADHGEAFGEHGEIGHSIFVYDTTLRVPLVISGPGVPVSTVGEPVSLVDIAPTALVRLGLPVFDSDGIDLIEVGRSGARQTAEPQRSRVLYAESFAPLLDFGWSPLRSIRRDGWKYIAAPRPELFEVANDPDEKIDRAQEGAARVTELEAIVSRIAGPDRPRTAGSDMDPDAARRLRSLGYVGAGGPERRPGPDGSRPDPKDRRTLAAQIARVTSGELAGAALRRELEAILAADASNPQAHMRLAFTLAEAGDCAAAEPHFRRAIALRIPSSDPHLGLAGCQAGRGDRKAAIDTLSDSLAVEKDNPVALANLGILKSELGDHDGAVAALARALALDPDFHQARFNLAIAFARAGRRAEAAREAQTLLTRLPADAPQRPEVERLRRAVQ
jgi:choline-sulfatase